MGVGIGGNWVWVEKCNLRDPYGDGNGLYLDCINVDRLVEILYYSFTDVTIGENCAKSMWDLCIISYTYRGIQNYLKITSLTKKIF